MADKKPGFFKRLFKFGKKKEPEDEVETVEQAPAGPLQEELDQQAAEAERLAADALAAQQEQERQEEEARRAAAEAEAKRVAEGVARAEQARLEAEKGAAEREAQKRAEAERLAAEEESARIVAEKAEAERIATEAAERKTAEEAESARVTEEREERERAEEEKHAAAEAEAAARKEVAETEAKADKLRLAEEAAERERQEAERRRLSDEREKAESERRAAQEEAEKQEKERQKHEKALEEKRLEEERLARERAEQEAAEVEVKRLAEEQTAREAEERQLAERKTAEETDAEAERLAQEHTAREVELAAATEPPLTAPPAEEEPKKKTSWFNRLKGGLSRSSTQLTDSISGVFTKKKLDDDTLQDLEDILIRADLGIETAMSITDKLASQRMGKDVSSEEVRSIMADEIEAVLEPVAAELELDLDHQPHVILVVGVNGSGKTTTIGKLSQKLYDAGFSTLLVAGDTFRAAAIEQLKIWGDRTQSPVLSRPLGADAAGLAFDAYQQAKAEGRDVMLMDTAGRLQNRTELMDELAKIVRVLKKQDSEAPHTVLLTLDATTGQNALNQVEIFRDIAGVNGLVMTKLDGTARGGILVAISAKHKLPVFFLGVGEQVDDLEPFEAKDFARSIAGLA